MSYSYRNKCFIALPVTGVSPIRMKEIKQLFDSRKTDVKTDDGYKNLTVPWNEMICFSYQEMTIDSK